jgi:hypothetical protein
LASGGLQIRTSAPIANGEQLTVEFSLAGMFHSISVLGKVVWLQAHHNPAQRPDTHFRQGIQFVSVGEASRSLIVDYVYRLFWKEHPATIRELEQVLSEVNNFPVGERHRLLHTFVFCSVFAEANCPHQPVVERAYLIPQLMDDPDYLQTQNRCWNCDLYRGRPIWFFAHRFPLR